MSRKKTQPKKNVVPDPKFKSTIIPKLINNIKFFRSAFFSRHFYLPFFAPYLDLCCFLPVTP